MTFRTVPSCSPVTQFFSANISSSQINAVVISLARGFTGFLVRVQSRRIQIMPGLLELGSLNWQGFFFFFFLFLLFDSGSFAKRATRTMRAFDSSFWCRVLFFSVCLVDK